MDRNGLFRTAFPFAAILVSMGIGIYLGSATQGPQPPLPQPFPQAITGMQPDLQTRRLMPKEAMIRSLGGAMTDAEAGMMGLAEQGMAPADPEAVQGLPFAEQRRIERRRDLAVVGPVQSLASAFHAALAACVAPDCTVQSSHFLETETGSIQAMADLKVVPGKETGIVEAGSRNLSVRSDVTTSSDRTEQHVDTVARIRNLESLRDRFRSMLKEVPPGDVRAALEVERELSRTQQELDAMEARRISIERVTDRMHLSLSFGTPPSTPYAPTGSDSLSKAFGEFSQTSQRSAAEAVNAVAVMLPWALLALLIAAAARIVLWWRKKAP